MTKYCILDFFNSLLNLDPKNPFLLFAFASEFIFQLKLAMKCADK